MNNLFNYIEKESPVHRLTGATKFVCLLLWNFAAMYTYDTRFLLVMAIMSFFLFALSKIKLKEVSFMLGFTAVFVILNNILVYIFSPWYRDLRDVYISAWAFGQVRAHGGAAFLSLKLFH